MKLTVVFAIVFLCFLILTSGCTQQGSQYQQPTPPVQNPVAGTTEFTVAQTAVPASQPSSSSIATTTITRSPTTPAPVQQEIQLPVIVKDSNLHFTVGAPAGFMGRSIRVGKDLGYSTMFKTTIFNNASPLADSRSYDNSGNYDEIGDGLTIFTYTVSLNQDQDAKNFLRANGKNINETTVSYKGITYERFETDNDPFVADSTAKTVVFVGSKKTSNEKGYAVEIIYSISDDSKLGLAGHEKMVQSFTWIPLRNISNAPGMETDKPSFYQ